METIDACHHAGVTLIEAGKFKTPASSDEVPPKVDFIQYETGEGPCLEAIREREIFETSDLTKEHRWPNFAARANEETGVVSMLSFRLFVEGDTMGALHMYSKQQAAFADSDRAVGAVFAAHAGVALSTAIERHQLTEALKSRDVIGQAKGILMERENVTADEAYEILRRSSQNVNTSCESSRRRWSKRRRTLSGHSPRYAL